MAGVPPPPDLPAPAPGDSPLVSADASFPPSPDATDICGFKIPPTFVFSISLNIPFPSFQLPNFQFALSLKCDLDDPIGAEVSFGGGRLPTGDPVDPVDEDF